MKVKKITKERVKNIAIDLFFLIVGCSLGAFSLTAVLIPNGLTSGGLTGIVRIVQKVVPIDFSILFYGGSFIILILVFIFLGFKEVKKILLMTFLYPAVLMVFEQIPFHLLEEKDIILAAIFCGVFSGACTGIVFWRGYSFCGTDALAKILKKKLFPEISLSQLLLCLDAVIIICSAFVFGRNIALYALVTQVIVAKTIDFVMFGFETKIVQMEIITKEPAEIAHYIMKEINRGVTEMTVMGSYTKQENTKLITLCSPRESALIKRFVASHDKNAFVTVIQINNVWGNGEGFGDIEKE